MAWVVRSALNIALRLGLARSRQHTQCTTYIQCAVIEVQEREKTRFERERLGRHDEEIHHEDIKRNKKAKMSPGRRGQTPPRRRGGLEGNLEQDSRPRRPRQTRRYT